MLTLYLNEKKIYIVYNVVVFILFGLKNLLVMFLEKLNVGVLLIVVGSWDKKY